MGKKNKVVSRDTPIAQDRETLESVREQMIHDMWTKLLKTFEGRFILFTIIGKGDIYNFEGRSYEPNMLQRQTGRYEMALEILNDVLTVMPDVYIMMQKEAETFNAQFKLDVKHEEEEDNG